MSSSIFSLLVGINLSWAQEPTEPTEASGLMAKEEKADMQIVYTGNRRGLASEKYPFASLRHLKSALGNSAAKLKNIQRVHGGLAQKDWVVLTDDTKVQTILDFLAGGEVKCGEAKSILVFENALDTIFLESQKTPDYLEALSANFTSTHSSMQICTNAAGGKVNLYGPAIKGPEITWNQGAFEFRQALDLQVDNQGVEQELLIVGRPRQESSRTFTEIFRLQKESPHALYVDAGNFLDGASSVKDNSLSLHRPLGLEILKRLKPAALVPGKSELLMGAGSFFAEIKERDLPYIATNWTTEKEASWTFPRSVVRTAKGPNGPIIIAFVGALDPQLQHELPMLAEEGIKIADPLESIQAEVDRLGALPEPPAVVMLLTTGSAEMLELFRRKLRGVHLMAGDSSFATLRVEERSVSFRNLGKQTKGSPLTVSMDGIASVDLYLDESQSQLQAIKTHPWLVYENLPLDAKITTGITKTRVQSYPHLDKELIRPNGEGFDERFSQDQWDQIVCETLRRETQADSVLLQSLPPITSVPGSLSELKVVEQLAIMDRVELHKVPGDKLPKLLDQSYGNVEISCGALPGIKFPKARGRFLEADRMYRVVTTDLSRKNTFLDLSLNTNRSIRMLDQPSWKELTNESGNPLTLRYAVLKGLRELRDEKGVENLATHLLTEAPTSIPSIWLMRIRQLSLATENFQGTENDSFAAVPETMANTPSSATLGSAADVSLDYSSSNLRSDLRFRSSFSKLLTEEEEQEVTDDLILSTYWAVPAVLFPKDSPFRLMPYTELLYDSEFTPTEQEDGTLNPKQTDLSLTMGLASMGKKQDGQTRARFTAQRSQQI